MKVKINDELKRWFSSRKIKSKLELYGNIYLEDRVPCILTYLDHIDVYDDESNFESYETMLDFNACVIYRNINKMAKIIEKDIKNKTKYKLPKK